MKVNFKNTTKYTKETYEKFLTFHQKKYGTKYKIYTLVVIILLAFCVAMNFRYGNIGVGFIFLVSVVCFLLYRFFHPLEKIKKESNSDKIKNEMEYVFTFYNHFMHVSGNGISQRVRYWKLKKAFEDREYFYLYITDEYAFAIKKNGFSIGTYRDFMTFIKKKILFKI